jgi:hypothetical protein
VPRGVAPMVTDTIVPWLLSLLRPTTAAREIAQQGKA